MNTLLEQLREGRKDIKAYLRGDGSRVTVTAVAIPDDVDVKAIREAQGLSQAEFAKAYGFKVSAVKSWERTKSRRKPDPAARMYLTVIDREPAAVPRAIGA